ncbi:ba98c03c-1469-414a-9876-16196effce01 [Sclerotinia trifoliorum]|uniref:Ba98c03c-1469-414a-9876-16196effce01 n=1 Tax=Sclerotinia trifoliorum TaxID=28548 RepID=A0A8H2VXR9_9HELO|nr:ba98c03c-1469-414a-9876-16196effce01 [Sclerotinia trifoliorum]
MDLSEFGISVSSQSISFFSFPFFPNPSHCDFFPHTSNPIHSYLHNPPQAMYSPISLLTLLPLLPFTLAIPAALPIPIPSPEVSTINAMNSSTTCTDIHIITARASTEAPGEGIIGTLASAIELGTKQSVTRTSVSYPALLDPYPSSVASGVAAMKTDLIAAVEACPEQKIVLLGYSQGAECISDTLGGGGGGLLGTKTPAVDYAKYGSHVKAAIVMGDPRYMTNQQSFHVGTCFQNGLFPRSSDQSSSLASYSSILKSYCDFGDPFCCSGGDMLEHLTYVVKYNEMAVSFVLGMIG